MDKFLGPGHGPILGVCPDGLFLMLQTPGSIPQLDPGVTGIRWIAWNPTDLLGTEPWSDLRNLSKWTFPNATDPGIIQCIPVTWGPVGVKTPGSVDFV